MSGQLSCCHDEKKTILNTRMSAMTDLYSCKVQTHKIQVTPPPFALNDVTLGDLIPIRNISHAHSSHQLFEFTDYVPEKCYNIIKRRWSIFTNFTNTLINFFFQIQFFV